MRLIAPVCVGMLGFAVYEFCPASQCLTIAEILDSVSDKTVFVQRWGLSDEAACVFASEQQREAWLRSAQTLRYTALQLNQTMRPTAQHRP